MSSLRSKLLLATLAVIAGAAVLAGSASASPIGHIYAAYDSASANADYSATPKRANYVILQAWETAKMHAIKSANPAVKVLVYKNLAFSAQATGGLSSTGVATQEAPESWFLKNTTGERISSSGYNWLWAMDVGSPEYQRKWTENVLAELEKGWDGVFLDDCNPTMKYSYDPSQVAKYPNDTAYSAAMESAVAYIGPRIQAGGKLAIPNFASWVEYPETYNRWLGYVSGAVDEMFGKWSRNSGEGYRGEGQWTTQVNEAKYAASVGKVFIAFTQGAVGETQAARFGYASVLLGGNSAASFAFTPDYTTETWMPEYEYELGAPQGAETRESSGVHRRLFEKGLVLVNPTSSTQTVSFGGTYSGSGLSNATGTTMPAHSGLVLTGAPAPAAPAPTPVEPIKVTVTVGQNEASLTWIPPTKTKAKRFRVVRNRHMVAQTRTLHRTEHGVARGHLYSFQIIGLDAHGKVVAKSRPMRVRGSNGRKRVVIQRSSRRA